jgi:cardiolipin synthase
MIIQDWKKDFFTIPNWLSLFRLLLIPVYVVIYLNAAEPVDYAIAAAILAVSCLTDAIDGKIARKFNMISTIGKFLDPLADKLTQFTLIVCLALRYPVQNPMLWVLAGLMFIKEIFQLVAGIVQFRKGKMLTGALLSGKICTTILFISLILMVLIPNMESSVITSIAIVDAVFMLISFAHYALTYYKKAPMIQNIEDHEDRKR